MCDCPADRRCQTDTGNEILRAHHLMFLGHALHNNFCSGWWVQEGARCPCKMSVQGALNLASIEGNDHQKRQQSTFWKLVLDHEGWFLLVYSAAGAHSHGYFLQPCPSERAKEYISRVHAAIILIWLGSASTMVPWWTTCMPRSSTIDPSPCNGSFHRNHCCIPFRATAATITIVGTHLATGIAAMKIASGTWGDVHIPAEGSSEDRHHLT